MASTLVATLALPATASAKAPVPPDTLAIRPASSGFRGAWSIFTGEPSADTLRAPVRAVFLAALEALHDDSWEFRIADVSHGRLVTHWKPLKHILVRLFMGRVQARCYVNIASFGARSSIVTFRGALATMHSLEGNPMLPHAMSTYRKEARSWHDEVRSKLGLEPLETEQRKAAR